MSRLFCAHLRTLWVYSTDGQQGWAQENMMYKGNSSAPQWFPPPDPAVVKENHSIMHVGLLTNACFHPDPQDPALGGTPWGSGGKRTVQSFSLRGTHLVSHFPRLVSEAGEALGFQKIGSAQRQKASFVRREGSGEAQGSQRCFINLESEWSAGPQFCQEQNLQNGKNQNSKKLSRCRALSGKRAGPRTVLL